MTQNVFKANLNITRTGVIVFTNVQIFNETRRKLVLDSQRSDIDEELVNSHLNGSNLMCENDYPITESQMMLNESSEINSQLVFFFFFFSFFFSPNISTLQDRDTFSPMDTRLADSVTDIDKSLSSLLVESNKRVEEGYVNDGGEENVESSQTVERDKIQGRKVWIVPPLSDVRLEFSKMEHLTKLERERSNKVDRREKEILTREKKMQTKQKELELLEKKLRETRINN